MQGSFEHIGEIGNQIWRRQKETERERGKGVKLMIAGRLFTVKVV